MSTVSFGAWDPGIWMNRLSVKLLWIVPRQDSLSSLDPVSFFDSHFISPELIMLLTSELFTEF